MKTNKASVMATILALLNPLITIAAQDTFRVVHYNIRELDCAKLSNAEKDLSKVPQVKEALNIIKSLNPDILSINEIQYDRFQQPTKECTNLENEKGQNIKRMARLMGFPETMTHLGEANTGADAKPKANGEFYTSPEDPEARYFADPMNFGIFPGQYSTGFVSKLPSTFNFFTYDLTWKAFNPKVNLAAFRYLDKRDKPEGELKTLDEKVYQLFDKNFTDMIVTIKGKPVHVILLHTIVGGNFGNEIPDEQSPNELRNAEELAFLEWYLTGETTLNGEKFNAPSINGISPLPANTPFIAMGDWNVDMKNNPDKPGAKILKSLFSKAQRWFKEYQPTQETWNFKPTTKPTQLDYMVVSKHFEIVKSGGYYPEPKKVEVGTCGGPKPNATNANRVVAEYKKQGMTCFVEVNKDYYLARVASDHYPIWAELKLK